MPPSKRKAQLRDLAAKKRTRRLQAEEDDDEDFQPNWDEQVADHVMETEMEVEHVGQKMKRQDDAHWQRRHR